MKYGIAEDLSQSDILKAIKYCVKNELWSATSFVSVIEDLDKFDINYAKGNMESFMDYDNADHLYNIETEIREHSEYENLTR